MLADRHQGLTTDGNCEQGAVRKYSLTYYLWTRFTVRARYRAIGTVPVPWPAPAVRESRTHIAHMLLPVA